MAKQTHRIERQILEIEVADASDGRRLQEVLSRLQRQSLAGIIERTLDEIADPDTLVRIERLTVDLGEIKEDAIEVALGQSLRRELRAGIERALRSDAAGAPRPRQVDAHAAAIDELTFFARTGALPWSAATRDARHLGRRLQEALEGSPQTLSQALRELAREPPALARLAAHFGDAELATLIDLLLYPYRLSPLGVRGDATAAVDELRALLDSAQDLPGRSSTQRRNLAWSGLLVAAACHRPGARASPAELYEAAFDELSRSTGRPLTVARERARSLERGGGQADPRARTGDEERRPAETAGAGALDAFRAAAQGLAAASGLALDAPERVDGDAQDPIARGSHKATQGGSTVSLDRHDAPSSSSGEGPESRARRAATSLEEGKTGDPKRRASLDRDGPADVDDTASASDLRDAQERNLTQGADGRPPRAKPQARAQTTASGRATGLGRDDASGRATARPGLPQTTREGEPATDREEGSPASVDAPAMNPERATARGSLDAPEAGPEQRSGATPKSAERGTSGPPKPPPTDPRAPDAPAREDNDDPPLEDDRRPSHERGDAGDRRVIDAIATWSDAADRSSALLRGQGGSAGGQPAPGAKRELQRLVEALVALGNAVETIPEARLDALFDHREAHLPERPGSIQFSLMALAGRAAPKLSREAGGALTRSLTRLIDRRSSQERDTERDTTSPGLGARAPRPQPRSQPLSDDPPSPAQTPARPQRRPPPPPRPGPTRARSRGRAFVDSDRLHVDDAGLVILSPFLPHLFGHLDLLDGRTFRDSSAQLRAAALLRVAAAGEEELAEYQLPLAKLLCGLEVDALFELDTPLTEPEIEECTRMLEALIARATILKEMSVGGLRGSFLLRPGVLAVRDGGWFLRVERRAYDLVLARFPWTFEWVKLPWMSAPIQVEW